MNLNSLSLSSLLSLNPRNNAACLSSSTPPAKLTTSNYTKTQSHPYSVSNNSKELTISQNKGSSCSCSICSRRHFLEALAASPFLSPVFPSKASTLETDYRVILNGVHPSRPDWYEELYASVLDTSMKSYEAEIADYKKGLFSKLRGNADNVLEIGIGTGPNIKFYVSDTDVHVFGIDPNQKMERYARAAAESAGLPAKNFKFIQAVGEAIPLSDASVDAVIGTLVLCSVTDVNMTLAEVKRILKPGGNYFFIEHVAAKDGTVLRFLQSILDPLQQTVADGCHLTRETWKYISDAGFSGVELNNALLSNASLISPHIYGIACK